MVDKLSDEQFDIWMAGFFDADGMIYSDKRNKQCFGIKISQADPTILFEITMRYGGIIRYRLPSAKANQVKPWYSWELNREVERISFLKRIYPYLVSKKGQAKLALDLWDEEDFKTYRSLSLERRMDLIAQSTEMKKRQFPYESLTPEQQDMVTLSQKMQLNIT